jgi:alkanesulfonate monooxygenase SsuD/methylene tetrahydromethanopterin reductase-like flavin-dependent oxidoreductase (luciferase family)
MRYGYWLPVFGGWLRNVEDEGMAASWDYVSRLARRSEEIGYDITLIAELNLNDIKGPLAPSLDAWSTAAALAAVTRRLELMVAVRPNFHLPALLAKQAANIDHISGGRLSLNVVSSCGRMRQSNTASHSSSTTTATLARRNGLMFWTAFGDVSAPLTPANIFALKIRRSNRSPSRGRGL